MGYPLESYKNIIIIAINKALGGDYVQASDLIFPPNRAFGDFCLVCFEPAKKIGQAPAVVAQGLVGKLAGQPILSGCQATGPYFNLTIKPELLAEAVISRIEQDAGDYGRNNDGKSARVMVEFSNANTHKEFHVGHLRNLSFGDSVSRLLTANGFRAIPVSYINDFGIHVAKTLWCLEKFYQQEELPDNKGFFLGKVYVRANEEMAKDQLAKEMVSFLMQKIESRQGEEYRRWQETRQWSIEQFAKIYQELGVKFEHTFYESEYIDRGREMVAELYAKNFLAKSQGAIIADLEQYGLGALMFLRTDGTALYPVADLPLAVEKFKKFKPAKSIYVVDIRQSLYFRQLFKVLALLGYRQETFHLGYEFVKLPEGMMSSRTGKVITYEDLRSQLINKAEAETAARHSDWDKEKASQTALKLANGAIKFELLKTGADKAITFDINQALCFEGFTAGYLQYTYARIKSICRKAISNDQFSISKQKGNKKVDFKLLKEDKENQLVLQLARYPEIVVKAGAEYNPAEIAKYLFELAQSCNDYYHSVPVLKAEETTASARLALISAVAQVITNGLDLLGIEAVEEM